MRDMRCGEEVQRGVGMSPQPLMQRGADTQEQTYNKVNNNNKTSTATMPLPPPRASANHSRFRPLVSP